MSYQPKTGAKCGCKRGIMRDNCPNCEGTGYVIDFAKIRARNTPRTAHLCKCNNCDTVMIDQNSQVGAKEHILSGTEVAMQFDEKESMWMCPICKTDDYLIDL